MSNIRVKKHVSQRKVKQFVISFARIFFLICICFVVLYPLFLKISISFMSVMDLYDSSVVFLPKNWTFSNWKLAIEAVNYLPTMLKTLGFASGFYVDPVLVCMVSKRA